MSAFHNELLQHHQPTEDGTAITAIMVTTQ